MAHLESNVATVEFTSSKEVMEPTDLVSALLGTQSQIGNIHSLAKTCLRRRIKNCIERDVLEELVHSQLVRIRYHDDGGGGNELI